MYLLFNKIRSKSTTHEEHIILEGNLFEKFKKLGWGNDQQSLSIFNFLLEARFQVSSNDIVLDLGAGECRYAFFFDHCNYLSVDFAKGESEWDYSCLDFIGNICNLAFIRDNSIDLCLSTTTLEHINEPDSFFSEIKRILKPGGKLYLYVPFVIPEHQVPYDFYRYTSYGLKYLCKKNGLIVVSVKPSNGPLYTAIRWAFAELFQVRKDRIILKYFLKILKGVFKFILIPLFDRLEVFSTDNNFPQCWLLTAAKEGSKNDSVKKYKNKGLLIKDIIRCPECKAELVFTSKSCVCSKCNKEYEIKNGQIVFID